MEVEFKQLTRYRQSTHIQVVCMEHIGRSTLKVCSDAPPPTHHPGSSWAEFHFGLGKKVKIFRFAIKVVELVGVKYKIISAYKSKHSSQRSPTAYSVRRVRNVSV